MIITKLDEKICSDTFFKYKWARLKYLINEKCWKEMKCFVFMILIDINNKYKMNYKFLTKNIVNQYIGLIEINDKSEIKVVYKN